MRLFAALAVLVAAGPAAAQAPPDTLDVFLIGGQFNATGAGGDPLTAWLPRVGEAYWAGVRQLSSGPTTRLFDIAEGHKYNRTAWPAFARRYTYQTGRRVLFLQTAFGGTTNVADADAGRGHWSATTDGPGASGGPNHLALARAELASLFRSVPDGVVLRAVGVLWIQGESDADQIDNGVTTQDAYRTELEATARALRESLAPYRGWDDPLAPMFAAQIGYRLPEDTPGYQQVRAAQDQVAATGALTLACKHGLGFGRIEGRMVDDVHWSQGALNHVGHHMAEAAVRDVTPPSRVIGEGIGAVGGETGPTAADDAAPRRPFPNPAVRGHTVRGLPPQADVFDALGRRVAATTRDGALVVDLQPGVYLVGGSALTVR